MGAEYNGAAGDGDRRGSGRPAAREELDRRLRGGRPLVLDGATGTELERRGLRTGLPLWSTHALLEAPETVAEIHRSYRRAGADIVTADTFRTQRRTLARANLGDRDRELTALAVTLARRAEASWVAGSAPPLEDCYRPDLVPDRGPLEREHAIHADNLASAGVDLILVETMNCVREASAACTAAVATGLPCWVSFVCWEGASLLSGEPLAEAVDRVCRQGARAVLVNCLPPSSVPACLPVLSAAGIPFGVYANLGAPDDETGFRRSEDCGPAEFARLARQWLAAGARIVGGCCGTTPEHIAAVAEEVRGSVAP